MNEEKSTTEVTKRAPVNSGPHLIGEILKYIDPAPDEETECFVAAIYADRRESAKPSPAE
jgi:hypothetical protein